MSKSTKPSITTTIPSSTLRKIRQSLDITQATLAAELGTSQPAVLKTESATNPRVESVRTYVEGLARAAGVGHDLQFVGTIGENRFKIRFPKVRTGDFDTSVETRTDTLNEPAQNGWRLRGWDDPDLEVVWQERGLISMGGSEMGDLSNWPGEAEVRRRLREALPERKDQAIGMFVTYWRYFRVDMAPGDIVVVPLSRKRVAIARVVSEYRYDEVAEDFRLWHHRSVEWLRTTGRATLDEDIRKVVNAPGTICQLGMPGAVRRLAG